MWRCDSTRPTPHVILDGEDVSRLLHTDTISLIVSDVATNLDARAVLGDMQRHIIDASRAAERESSPRVATSRP